MSRTSPMKPLLVPGPRGYRLDVIAGALANGPRRRIEIEHEAILARPDGEFRIDFAPHNTFQDSHAVFKRLVERGDLITWKFGWERWYALNYDYCTACQTKRPCACDGPIQP